MVSQSNYENAGGDFDRWLDWNGTANTNSNITTTNKKDTTSSINRPYYPVSPSSTTNDDALSSALKSQIHTAPSSTGPLTPSHGTGSPEIYAGVNIRLSGDTLCEEDSLYRQTYLKRKLSSSEENDDRKERTQVKMAGSKRPHNVIEKRYRANLNDKIAELRDSVPSLRKLQKARTKEEDNVGSDNEDNDGVTPSGKLNKASILTKAVEYIRHLELRNKRLEEENKALKDRLQTLDRVLARGGNNAERAAAFTTENVIEQKSEVEEGNKDDQDTSKSSRGLLPVPESWKRMRQQNGPSEHYGHVYQNASERPRFGGKWTGRIMLGSMASLLVFDGISQSDHGTDSREKGLFGIPLEILDGWTFLRSPRAYLTTFADYCHTGGVIPLIKGFLALSILAFFIFAYLFNSRPHPEREPEKEGQQPQAARPASPIEVRRRAWSTSMQALNLPHHSFFPEWLALTSEWTKYTIQFLVGPQIYNSITGRSVDDETARIKAWDIAVDAQLAGGDIEVSRSRAVLTIFGSGTLPRTPFRLMQKALHCRVLLWNVGVPGTTASRIANLAATYFANRQWRRARQLHENLSAQDIDRLPGYLNYMLQMDCDDVFNDVVTQHAFNLMYDRPTSEYAEDDLMDVVVEDHAIRSPLDAIAAWRSTCALREALKAALKSPDSPDTLREHVQSALEIAPPDSTAETRALAVHAVLSPGRRNEFYMKAKDATTAVSIRRDLNRLSVDPTVPYFIDSSTPISARPEITACLHCAKIMLMVEQERDLSKALTMLADISNTINPTSTMLTTAPLYFVLYRLRRAKGSSAGGISCITIATELSNYFSKQRFKKDVSSELLTSAIDFLSNTWDVTSLSLTPSLTPSRRHSMISNDTGYASLSEQEEQTFHALAKSQ